MGFKGIKIKCRLEEPMFERLKAIRDAAGVDFKVTVDPNERFYTAEQAIELSHRLETLGNVEVLEDPSPKPIWRLHSHPPGDQPACGHAPE